MKTAGDVQLKKPKGGVQEMRPSSNAQGESLQEVLSPQNL